jgi:hypothetical protein
MRLWRNDDSGCHKVFSYSSYQHQTLIVAIGHAFVGTNFTQDFRHSNGQYARLHKINGILFYVKKKDGYQLILLTREMTTGVILRESCCSTWIASLSITVYEIAMHMFARSRVICYDSDLVSGECSFTSSPPSVDDETSVVLVMASGCFRSK